VKDFTNYLKSFPEGAQVLLKGYMSMDLLNLLTRLLNFDPKLRPSAQDLLEEPWIAGISDPDFCEGSHQEYSLWVLSHLSRVKDMKREAMKAA
jgi:serine/threonine protein kinase